MITAPIDGIVIQRSVDVGQTVAASMQAPTLFIIAADLTKMQVSANIDESDVGRIRPGQTVTFRVDAYPGEQFEGTVAQIRLQPVVVQNVTTYGTIIDVPNPELKLKPGMTANLRVQIAKRSRRGAGAERRAAVPADQRHLRRAEPGACRPSLAADAAAAADGAGADGRRPATPTQPRLPAVRAAPTGARRARGGAPARPQPDGRAAPGARRRGARSSQRRRGDGDRAAGERIAGRRAASAAAATAAERRRWRRPQGAAARALQGDVAGRAEAVHRAPEGARARTSARSRSAHAKKAPAPRGAKTAPHGARPSTRCSRRCRSSRRAAAPGSTRAARN